MKISRPANHENALTLIEVIVVVCVVVIVASLLLPAGTNKARVRRIQCMNNLKQIGLAFRDSGGGSLDRFRLQVSTNQGGSTEFASGPNEWRHFQVMSNELSTPRVLICMADSRFAATNFATLSNSNISYFIGVQANDANPQMILAGDRNITNGTPIENGILELTTNRLSGWTAEMHNGVGNLLLSDGSVQQVSMSGLRSAVENTGLATNRLQMPVLSQ